MVEHLRHPEWRDELEDVAYPFADGSTLVSTDGFAFSNETFVDASVYPIGGGEGMYISQAIISNREVELHVGDPTTLSLAKATFDPLDPPEEVMLFDDFGRPAGILVARENQLSSFQAWPPGTQTFLTTATQFAARATIPTPEIAVRGILTEAGDVVTGDIWIVGEDGVVIREEDGNIRVDIVGDPLFLRRLCEGVGANLFRTPTFLRTINGKGPDDYGNFHINVGDHVAPDTVLRITPSGNGLLFEVIGQRLQG
jgi:hypothetical protein